MHEYKVLWRMKNSDKYLSVKTSEKSRASVMYNDGISFEDRDRTELGRLFYAGSGEITLGRFCRQLGRIVSADPLLVYYKVQELGAEIADDFRLRMTEEAAIDLQQTYAIFTDFSTGIEISNPVLLVDGYRQKIPVTVVVPKETAVEMKVVPAYQEAS